MVLTLMMPVAAFAANDGSQENETGEYGIIRTVDKDNRTVSVYQAKETMRSSQKVSAFATVGDTYAETKDILRQLGMEEDFIQNLSVEDLALYAKSTKIVGTVSYVKIDKDENASYLPEKEALRQAQSLNSKAPMNMMMSRSIQQDKYEDSYMRVFYLTSYYGNGSYLFSTDARWLTMPFFRGKDTIGSCAQNCTVTPNTGSGYYEYDVDTIVLGKITSDSKHYSMSSSNFKTATNGSFYGSAAVIDLPNDVSSNYSSILYSNYKAHYQYKGHVNSPNEEAWFNTTGTYDHSQVSISFSPSVSIDLDGVSPSIGLSIVGSTKARSVELEVHYRP